MANAPTEDIASRLVEQSAIIFKIADCSNNMKGSLVRELHESVALVRAATNLMATRAREARGGGGGNTEGLFKTIEKLRAENAWLRREMELIKARLPPPTDSYPARTDYQPARRICGKRFSNKRRRMAEFTDSEEEGKDKPPSLL